MLYNAENVSQESNEILLMKNLFFTATTPAVVKIGPSIDFIYDMAEQLDFKDKAQFRQALAECLEEGYFEQGTVKTDNPDLLVMFAEVKRRYPAMTNDDMASVRDDFSALLNKLETTVINIP